MNEYHTSNKAILEIEGINGVTEIIIYDLFGRIVENHKFAQGQNQLAIMLKDLLKEFIILKSLVKIIALQRS